MSEFLRNEYLTTNDLMCATKSPTPFVPAVLMEDQFVLFLYPGLVYPDYFAEAACKAST